jgi:hypothetical protein
MVAAIGPLGADDEPDPAREPPPHAAHTVTAPTTKAITLRTLMPAIIRASRYAERPCVR